MAHPMKGDAAAAHTAKMRNMTEDYGSASGPANNITSPQERLKGEGGERSIGFGINSDAPRTRADRSMRRTTPANPIATYAKGGRVKRDSGGDVSPIEEANKNQAAATPRARGGKVSHRLAGGQTGDSSRTEYARGGRAGHKKGATHVNVIVAPQGGGAGGPGAAPMMPPRPVPPVIAPPGGPPPGGAPPGMPPPGMPPRPPMGGAPMMPPGGMPPGMMPPRAKGGRIEGDEDRRDLVSKSLKDQGLSRSDHAIKRSVRADGGKIEKPNVPSHMTAGADSGIGRLEKAKMQEKSGSKKMQAV